MKKGIEIEQDKNFERKIWAFERIGMVFVILFLLSALVGLLGSGPISYKKSSGDNITVEYPMLVRFSHREDIKVTVGKIRDTLKLLINRDYLSSISIEGIIPEPVDQMIYKNFVEYNFVFSETEDEDIVFNVQFRKGGLLRGEWGIKDGDLIHITHFVFP